MENIMKIQVMSDLHLEFDAPEDMFYPSVAADTLVLAGDIHLGVRAKDWLMTRCTEYENIIFITGNHEYYRQTYNKLNIELRTMVEDINYYAERKNLRGRVHFLHNDMLVINGIKFLGTCLWSDFDNASPTSMHLANHSMNDFRLIKQMTPTGNYHRFRPEDALKEFKVAKRFLTDELNRIGEWRKTVVVTHHLPSFKSVNEEYKDDPLNGAFASDLTELFNKAHTWIHGHTHTSCDYVENGCRVVCNPRGYKNHSENSKFNPALVVEV